MSREVLIVKLRDGIPNLKVSGKWLNGREVRSEELFGSPVLFYFWSISCTTCKKAIPLLHQLRDQYKGRLKIISIHTPLTKDDNDLTEIRRVASDFNISEPLFADLEDNLSQAFKIRHVPAYFIFKEDGLLMHYQSGNSGIHMLKRRLDRVLK